MLCVATATTVFGMRATDAGGTALFRFSQVEHSACDNSQHNGDNDIIFHRASPVNLPV